MGEQQVVITDHAFERGKQRLSLSKLSLERAAGRAYRTGITVATCKGQLHKYLKSMQRDTATARIHGEVVFIFIENKLITVYQVPNELRRHAKFFKS